MPTAGLPKEKWEAAFEAFNLRRRSESATHLREGLRTSELTNLLRTVFETNLHASSTETFSANGTPRVPPLLATDAKRPEAVLFSLEVCVTRAYNIALSFARNGRIQRARVVAQNGHKLLQELPSGISLQTLCEQGATALEKEEHVPYMRRLADATVNLFELSAALALLAKDTNAAYRHATTARLWHRSAALLRRPGTEDSTRAPEPRIACVESLACATAGDMSKAIECLLPIAEEQDETYWPASYQAGALCVYQRRFLQNAKALLQRCVANAYRAPDALALLARVERPSEAVRVWQRVLALQHERFASVWEAAKVFGRLGLYEPQAILLECLLDMQPADARNHVRSDGTISLHSRWEMDECAVQEEYGKAKVLEGHATKGLEVLEKCIAMQASVASSDREKGILQVIAWATAATRDTERALRAANKFLSAFPCVSARLARADALLSGERCAESRQELELALQEVIVATQFSDSALQHVLRGVCYNNRAVLETCSGENGESTFAAAQVAFSKGRAGIREDNALSKWVNMCADVSAWNRVLVLWRKGRNADAASHWVGRRGSRSIDKDSEKNLPKPETHVMGGLTDAHLQQMDMLCSHVDEMERTRVALDNVIACAQDTWT